MSKFVIILCCMLLHNCPSTSASICKSTYISDCFDDKTKLHSAKLEKMAVNTIQPSYKSPVRVYRKINSQDSVKTFGKDFTQCQVTFHSHATASDAA